MVFTTENLLENISMMGAWSAYGMAVSALQQYFPEEYDQDGNCETSREAELLQKLNCSTWQDVIVKYHTEIGYKPDGGIFNPDCVNEC